MEGFSDGDVIPFDGNVSWRKDFEARSLSLFLSLSHSLSFSLALHLGICRILSFVCVNILGQLRLLIASGSWKKKTKISDREPNDGSFEGDFFIAILDARKVRTACINIYLYKSLARYFFRDNMYIFLKYYKTFVKYTTISIIQNIPKVQEFSYKKFIRYKNWRSLESLVFFLENQNLSRSTFPSSSI